ncbi:MAG: TetR/AcrR family transcriptional regulator [Rhodococcus sp.]|uniref:TetR/AcrR family transcriptional regulator n=1 Tax=Rhodococcus TaxID=1827 RepID=UPI0016ADAE66|nr:MULTISPECIES: TetR/AcrR family transcriptional regulator [Rhodococcus]NLV79760.1 TetR/AcrR family transcriptional regulator [Rhodococcus sp. (in: high G+C Gram-positive bacteria)]
MSDRAADDRAAKRRYRSPLRADAARRTRSSIRDAAARLFVRRGYVSTTVKQIAEEAGVAVRTVFTAFPDGKAQLFREALDEAVSGGVDDAGRPPVRRPAERRDSAADLVVEKVVGHGTAMLERAGDLLMTSVESSGADPDMRRFARDDARANADNARTIAEGLASSGWLRNGVGVDEAADVLYALSSPQVHALLRRDCGWSVDRYRTWIADTLRATLLR